MDETIQTSSKFQENNIHSIASNHNTKRKKERKKIEACAQKQTNKQTWMKPSQTSSKFQELTQT
jgi:hypothetical protein